MLLDEATASLDVENESAVQAALSRLLRGKTVLVIAHRMRTVAGADHIVVLEDGHVAQQGTPRPELMEQGGLTAAWWSSRPRAPSGGWVHDFIHSSLLGCKKVLCKDKISKGKDKKDIKGFYHRQYKEVIV